MKLINIEIFQFEENKTSVNLTLFQKWYNMRLCNKSYVIIKVE